MVLCITLMVIYMKASGLTIKLTAKESSSMPKVVPIKETGKIILEMDKEVNHGPMALNTLECFHKAKSMEWAALDLLIKAHMKVGLTRMKCVESVNTNGLMERCMKAVGQRTKCVEKAYL